MPKTTDDINPSPPPSLKYPLSNSFTLFSIILFIMSVFFTLFQRIPPDFGFLLIFMSVIFIISSLFSVFPEHK